MGMKPCWSCQSTGDCYPDCECAKCVDPYDYAQWKAENPEEYQDWLNRQRGLDEEGYPEDEEDDEEAQSS